MDEQKGFSPQMLEHFKKLGKSDEEIAAFAGSLAKQGQAARDAGLESKEADPPAEPVTAAPVYVTAAEVASAVGDALRPVIDALATLTTVQTAMVDDVKALKEADESKIAKAAAAAPRASLQELIAQSIVGNPAAVVDGRTALAKAGPKQTEAEAAGYTMSPMLNNLMNRAAGGVQ
jgi:hypothetical protein